MVDFLDSISRKIGSMDKRLMLLVAGVVVIGAFTLVVLMTLGGGGDDGDDLGEQMVFEDDGSVTQGGGVLVDAMSVAERVEATLEAMEPTATPVPPTPTPDIAATFEAELEGRRERTERILKLHPLDKDVVRNPYLNDAELEYLSDLGVVLWSHTKAWLHLRRVLFVDVTEWSHRNVEYHYLEAKSFLAEAEGAESRRDYELGEVVEGYGVTIEEGMRGIANAVRYLGEAERLLRDSESGLIADLSYEDREELGQLSRKVEKNLGDFDDAMSRYGCSVCGELFRLRGR